MRAADLDLRELLRFDPKGGVLYLGRQRILLFESVALGLLRSDLISTLGTVTARGLLTRFGYAHGWRTAESLRDEFPWDDPSEWRRAGGRLHMLHGLVSMEPSPRDGEDAHHLAEAFWHDSYEAEQHLLHHGQAEEAVCWTLTGFASGYLSFCNGREVYCIEEKCRGKGDAMCQIVGRFREDWGPRVEEELPYYQKDCLDKALVRVTEEIKRAERKLQSRRRELSQDKRLEGAVDETSGLIAQSESMRRLLEQARRVARVDTTLLITGESGVGKERLARLVHEESHRAQGPFIAVNCGAVPENLLESELFGHVKGSFTGAIQDRPGLFESANGGTLFLDEIGEIAPAMQVKLLRALQEREVRRIGENRSRNVNVRVLAATNRDLLAEIHAARFRQDLYYRLRVVELRIPPLRERRDDVLPLARSLLASLAARSGRRPLTLTPQAAHQLVRYAWPGNVRELENAIERAVVFAKGSRLDVEDLPEEIGQALPTVHTPDDARTLADVERDYIQAVLRANEGNKPKAAEQLGIGIATLYRKLSQYAQTPNR